MSICYNTNEKLIQSANSLNPWILLFEYILLIYYYVTVWLSLYIHLQTPPHLLTERDHDLFDFLSLTTAVYLGSEKLNKLVVFCLPHLAVMCCQSADSSEQLCPYSTWGSVQENFIVIIHLQHYLVSLWMLL